MCLFEKSSQIMHLSDPIVDTSKLINNFGHQVRSKLVLFSLQLQIINIVFPNFRIQVEMQKL